ncbi:MAG: hypothetical protein ABR499_20780 [Gemmatimonadaceae bacterium]
MRTSAASLPAFATLASALTLAACGGVGDVITGISPGPGGPTAEITLGVGEVRTIGAAEATSLRINGAAGGADFTLIPFHGTSNPASTVTLEFAGEQLMAASGPPTPQIGGLTPGLSLAHAGAVHAATSFEARLRLAERAELTSRIAASRAAYAVSGGARGAAATEVPTVGATMAFNAAPSVSCTEQSTRTGRVVTLTQRAVIVADNSNPAGGFTDAEYAAIGEEFDAHAHPMVTQTFGAPTDLDQNGGRVVVLFTRAVNELTPRGAQGITFGFFTARDVLRKSACAASNEAEILYMIVPDPAGEVNGNVRTKALVRRIATGTLAHEYQHLVNAARRVYVNNASTFEATWLNEGLSTIAEELMFYRVAGLNPRGNTTLETLRSSQSMTATADAYQVGNFNRLIEYLRDPESESPFNDVDDLATRGATWQFLRYAADRTGVAEQTLWQNLVNARTAGVANFNAVFGSDFMTLVRDWVTAQYTDDAVPEVPSTFQQPSWNYRSILPALTANSAYPLRIRPLAGGSVSLTLAGGGAAYLRFGVASGATGTVRVTSPSGAVPGAVSLTVVRTR